MDNLGLNRFNFKAPGFMARFLIAYWLVFSSGNLDLRGQTEIVVGSTNTIVATAFDHNTKDLYAIWKDSVRVFEAPEYKTSKFVPLPQIPDFKIEGYVPLIANSKLHFVHYFGGIVYGINNDRLERIDRSFDHRMQGASSMMIKNDTVFRYGGYGFWSNRNFFTFFSNSSKEWEIVLPHGKQEVPEGVNTAGMTHDQENTFIYGGYYRLPYELNDRTFYNKVWRFNWTEHKWRLLGSLNETFELAESKIDMGNRDLYYLSRRLLVVVDPSKNTISHFTIPDSRFDNACSDGMCHLSNNLSRYIDGFYQDGNFYLPFFYPGQKDGISKGVGTLIYKIVPESDFLITKVREEPLYQSQNYTYKIVAFVLVVISLFGSALWVVNKRKRKNKIWVQEDGLVFGGQSISLDPVSISILKILIAGNGEASAQQVMDLIENPTLSEGHKLKLRSQIVENLNLKLRTLLNIELDMIQIVRSSVDRRNKSYTLDVTRFEIQGQSRIGH